VTSIDCDAAIMHCDVFVREGMGRSCSSIGAKKGVRCEELECILLLNFILGIFYPSGGGKTSLSLETRKSLAPFKESRRVLLGSIAESAS